MEKLIINVAGGYVLTVGGFILAAMIFGFLTSNQLMSLLNKSLSFCIATFVYLLLLVIWPILTGFGLIFRRNWSRYSLFAMSVFTIFIGISSSVSLIFFPQYVYNVQVKAGGYITETLFSIINTIFFIGIPIYFIIFFNKKIVKTTFGARRPEAIERSRPFGITFIAVITFFTAIFSAIFIFVPMSPKYPLIENIPLPELWEKIYFSLIVLINLYISVGFLKMKKGAWNAFIIFYIISIIIGTVSSFAVTKMTFFEIVPSIQNSYRDMPTILYKLFGAMGFILPMSLLIYVISKKRLFSK
ncbi:MAG: hypothetical protein WC412_08520 [Candidatus Omnitrophota bacterium]|jgi:hypothetical protein